MESQTSNIKCSRHPDQQVVSICLKPDCDLCLLCGLCLVQKMDHIIAHSGSIAALPDFIDKTSKTAVEESRKIFKPWLGDISPDEALKNQNDTFYQFLENSLKANMNKVVDEALMTVTQAFEQLKKEMGKAIDAIMLMAKDNKDLASIIRQSNPNILAQELLGSTDGKLSPLLVSTNTTLEALKKIRLATFPRNLFEVISKDTETFTKAVQINALTVFKRSMVLRENTMDGRTASPEKVSNTPGNDGVETDEVTHVEITELPEIPTTHKFTTCMLRFNERFLVTGSENCVEIYDLVEKRPQKLTTNFQVKCLAKKDDKYLINACESAYLHVWQYKESAKGFMFYCSTQFKQVFSCVADAQGRPDIILLGFFKGSVGTFDLKSRKMRAEIKAHTGTLSQLVSVGGRDDFDFISGGSDGCINFFKISEDNERMTLVTKLREKFAVNRIEFVSLNRDLVICTGEKTMNLWDLKAQSTIEKLGNPTFGSCTDLQIIKLKKNKFLAVAYFDQEIIVVKYSLNKGFELLSRFKDENKLSQNPFDYHDNMQLSPLGGSDYELLCINHYDDSNVVYRFKLSLSA